MYSIERSKDNPSSPRIVLNVREIPGEDEWGKEAREARRKQEEEEERKYLEKKARKSKAKLVAKLRSEGKHNEADRLEKGELVESEPEKAQIIDSLYIFPKVLSSDKIRNRRRRYTKIKNRRRRYT